MIDSGFSIVALENKRSVRAPFVVLEWSKKTKNEGLSHNSKKSKQIFVVLRHATLEGNPSKVQSHSFANNKYFLLKPQINLIFSIKSLCISNICCTFAATKVK